ncbi:MAG: hypothetical protein QOF82_436 [Frankiales bacterium]|jgi:hypothetical protein|nr:hypothetical protein [Frankiales bacterium]MDX6211349.1 hypothetical protein [Frankiales bacterium]
MHVGRSLFFLGLGATVGVLVVRKVQKTADSLSPSGVAGALRSGLADLTDAVRDFGDEVQVAMLERETDLRAALGLDDDGAAT